MFIELSREKLRNPDLSDVVWSACEELSRQGVKNYIHKVTESKPTIIELFNPPARMKVLMGCYLITLRGIEREITL